jgi:hypothetical protein
MKAIKVDWISTIFFENPVRGTKERTGREWSQGPLPQVSVQKKQHINFNDGFY